MSKRGKKNCLLGFGGLLTLLDSWAFAFGSARTFLLQFHLPMWAVEILCNLLNLEVEHLQERVKYKDPNDVN